MAPLLWFKNLTKNPIKSWAIFKLGLIIFCCGACLILIGVKFSVWFQIVGLPILGIGLSIAAVGYAGILLYRLTSGFKPPPAFMKEDKSDNKHNES